MKKILSVYFANDRNYLAEFGVGKKGLELLYINSTWHAFDFNDVDGDESQSALAELEIMISEVSQDADKLCVTLPSDCGLVTQFPGEEGMGPDEIKQMVNLEIRQAFPQYNAENFVVNVVPFAPQKDLKSMMAAVIIPAQDLKVVSEILKPVKNYIDRIEIAQFNVHSAFLYNYPERKDQTVALLGVQENFVDISVVQNGKPVYYNLAVLESPDKIAELVEAEFTKLTENYVEQIHASYFFGPSLTKEMLLQTWEVAMMLGIESEKLNAFRMMSTSLEAREREYCSRTAHLYAPCVGAAIVPYHERIKIY